MFAIILLFTPSLGLFDTLHHGRLASLSVYTGQREFNHSQNGPPVTFEDAWEPYKIGHISLFPDIPVLGVVTILAAMFLFHILGSTCLLKLTMKNIAIPELVLQGFYTLITPPLHLDWEVFYRMSEWERSITECWKRLG